VLLASQIAVGSAALMAWAGLHAGLSPVAMAAWRLSLAATIVLPVVLRARRRGDPGLRADRVPLAIAGLCLAGHFVTWFWSLAYIPVARSTLLVCTSPIWAALAERALHRSSVRRGFWLGLGAGLLGAWMLGGSRIGWPTGPEVLGDGLAVAGAALFAAYLLLTRELQDRIGTARVVGVTYPVAAVGLWLALAASGGRAAVPQSPAAWASVVGMALLPQALGHTAMNWSLRHFSVAAVCAATLLEPVFAGALAWVILGQELTALQCWGAILLLAGVWLAIRAGASEPRRSVGT